MEARRLDRARFLNRIPLEYLYTPGIAGQRFFEALRESGKLLASRCRRCGEAWIPARLFCASCFARIEQFEEVEPRGRLAAFTWREKNGQLVAYGLIRFEGYRGGLVHRLLVERPEQLSEGLPVVARLSERRQGSWEDLVGFEPSPQQRGPGRHRR
ncbi:MAG: hypothetical protein C4339_02005 [Nitrososphaerota archaeon]